MRENQEFPVDFVGTFLKYNASAATFELKMYGTVTINVPWKQGFGVYQKIFRPVMDSVLSRACMGFLGFFIN